MKISAAAQVLRQEILARKLATEAQLDGELTIPFMSGCHSKVNQYLSLARSADVEHAYNKPARIEAGRAEAAKLKAKKLWDNPQSPEDLEASLQEVRKFVAQYRQFDGKNLEDRNAMIQYLTKHNLLITLPNLMAAFEHLVLAGELTLLPEQIDAAWESEVTGYKLQHHPHLAELLAQHPIVDAATAEQRAIEKMSADDYQKKYLQNEDTLPPLIQRRIEGDVTSFLHAHPELQSGATTKEILMNYIESNGWVVSYNSLQAAYAECR